MLEYFTLAPAGLLELLEAMQGIRKHVTDTAGAVDRVFDLCHLLGFSLAPRICDLNERRLYGLSLLDPWPTLRPLAPVL
jgi:TnpA family transposase